MRAITSGDTVAARDSGPGAEQTCIEEESRRQARGMLEEAYRCYRQDVFDDI